MKVIHNVVPDTGEGDRGNPFGHGFPHSAHSGLRCGNLELEITVARKDEDKKDQHEVDRPEELEDELSNKEVQYSKT